ncbi:MAG: hypothetical protein ACRCX2_13920 [Paraclostridium sp.]
MNKTNETLPSFEYKEQIYYILNHELIIKLLQIYKPENISEMIEATIDRLAYEESAVYTDNITNEDLCEVTLIGQLLIFVEVK